MCDSSRVTIFATSCRRPWSGPITLAMSDASGDWQVCGYTFERLDVGS